MRGNVLQCRAVHYLSFEQGGSLPHLLISFWVTNKKGQAANGPAKLW
jgi:hypothetical protein